MLHFVNCAIQYTVALQDWTCHIFTYSSARLQSCRTCCAHSLQLCSSFCIKLFFMPLPSFAQLALQWLQTINSQFEFPLATASVDFINDASSRGRRCTQTLTALLPSVKNPQHLTFMPQSCWQKNCHVVHYLVFQEQKCFSHLLASVDDNNNE